MGISDDRFSAEASSGDWQVFQAIKVRLYARSESYARAFSFFIRSFIKSHSSIHLLDFHGREIFPGPAIVSRDYGIKL